MNSSAMTSNTSDGHRPSRLQLFRMLRRHISLSAKRSAAYSQNRVAKMIIYLMGGFAVVYIIFIAVLMALIANETTTVTPYEFFFGLSPFILFFDFLLRFTVQQTPAQLTKPYSLLPIPKHTCVELFIILSIVKPVNLVWLALSVPYAVMTLLFAYGPMAALGLIFAFQIMVTINSQWYMLVRTLINKSLLWWLFPTAVYAAIFSPAYLDSIELLTDFFASAGAMLTFWHPLGYLCLFVLLAIFVLINRRVQYIFTYLENAGSDHAGMKSVSKLSLFDRYGQIGEYIKLETKSLMRNMNLRKPFAVATLGITVISLIISYTDIYDSSFYRSFWIVYTYVIFGLITLAKIMSAEGNYIDCLAVHKENILQLLTAKYYFYASMLLLPFLLMLPTVFTGKNTLLSLLSMLCFTAGPVYCLLMQMAVYNKQTIPLNTKFINKGGIETNYFQTVADLAALFLPTVFISMLRAAFSETVAYIVLLTVGIAFISAHKIWIANIYHRFMKRRYINMESFRATR